jgi:hypothetical protein
LRKLVLNSPNPRKSLNYFRSKFSPYLPRIAKSEKFPNPLRVTPSHFHATPGSDDLSSTLNGEASPPCTSQDGGHGEPERFPLGVAVAVISLHVPSGTMIKKTSTVEKAEAMAPLPVFLKAIVQEATCKLWNARSMASMKVFSVTSDVGTEGEVARVRTTEVLQHTHASATPALASTVS